MRKILVVDDSETIRTEIKMCLANPEYEILEADNGKAAVKIALSNPDLALIITDFHMPWQNGIQMAIKIFEQQPDLKGKLPILLSTAHSGRDLVKAAKEAGIRGLLVKPIKQSTLAVLVDKLLYPEKYPKSRPLY